MWYLLLTLHGLLLTLAHGLTLRYGHYQELLARDFPDLWAAIQAGPRSLPPPGREVRSKIWTQVPHEQALAMGFPGLLNGTGITANILQPRNKIPTLKDGDCQATCHDSGDVKAFAELTIWIDEDTHTFGIQQSDPLVTKCKDKEASYTPGEEISAVVGSPCVVQAAFIPPRAPGFDPICCTVTWSWTQDLGWDDEERELVFTPPAQPDITVTELCLKLQGRNRCATSQVHSYNYCGSQSVSWEA